MAKALSETPHLATTQFSVSTFGGNGRGQAGGSPLVKLPVVRCLSLSWSLSQWLWDNLPVIYRDSWNKSPEERKFLRRLDACLITYATLSHFSKFLDQQNVTVSTHMILSYKKQIDLIHAPTIECLRIRDERGVGHTRPSYLRLRLIALGKVSTFMAINSIISRLRGPWGM